MRFDRLPRTEIAGAYAGADALLFCVEWPEPFGLVPLEAMAVGTPVVATGTGGSAEYLRRRRELPPGRAGRRRGASPAAVERLAGDPELRGGCAPAASRRRAAHACARFDEAIAAALERVAR